MTLHRIESQYATGLSRENIEHALIAAGKDLQHLGPADLAPLEDFHTSGRIASSQLAELAGITSHDSVLDAGSGIGGTSRFLAGTYGCKVTAIDLTEDYCRTARWLNLLVGLDDRISVRQGDVTELPFRPRSFHVVISQHVQMNVADKRRLYQEAYRVLVPGGRLAIWDVTLGASGELGYPLPWADRTELSHLASANELRTFIEAAGFTVIHWEDRTGDAAALMERLLSAPPGSLGLHNFVPDFTEKARNLTDALKAARLRVIQGVAHTSDGSSGAPLATARVRSD